MDITTVLQIIDTIENGIQSIHHNHKKDGNGEFIEDFANGQAYALWKLRDHLQNYIEGQVSSMETSTGM